MRWANVKVCGIQAKPNSGKLKEVGARTDANECGGSETRPPGLRNTPIQKSDESEHTERQPCPVGGLRSVDDEGIQGLVVNPDEFAIGEVRNRNAALSGAPGGFDLFDFSAMEGVRNKLLNARDNWVRVSGDPPALRYSGVLQPIQQEIEDCWQTEEPVVAEESHTLVKNRMALGEAEEKFGERLRIALSPPRNHAATRDSQPAWAGLINPDAIIGDVKDASVAGK